MKLIKIGLATALGIFAVAGTAQSTPAASLSQFAGTYKAEFHKQTWLVLTLQDSGSTLTGTLTHSAQLSADDEGDITSVSDDMSSDTITSVELEGSTLRLIAKDEDGSEERYSLVITGSDTAELTPITPDGSSPTKPFKLKKSPAEPK